MEPEILVKRFKCKCGKARLLCVIDPNGAPFSKESLKEQINLVKAGCDVETISLDQARESELCFTCKL